MASLMGALFGVYFIVCRGDYNCLHKHTSLVQNRDMGSYLHLG